MKSNAFIQYFCYWAKRSMKWLHHYTLMGDWRKMEVHFLVLFFTVGIAATDLMCVKISISSILLLCSCFGKLILLNLYKAYFYHFFTLISGIFVERAMRRSLEALNNKELRFILGDYSFPTKQSSH